MNLALLIGKLAAAGYDVRLAKRNEVVVRTRVSEQTLRRDFYPEGHGVIIRRPCRGYYVLYVPQDDPSSTPAHDDSSR